MVDRRQLLTGGVMSGMATALGADGAAAGQQREDGERVAAAIAELRQALER